ncbi:MAG TPA: hypothetical protein VF128_11495 [Gemmatimonadaceae bacterium]
MPTFARRVQANGMQVTDMVAMTALMKDVVKAKGVLLNVPEIIVTPLVPFVATFAASCPVHVAVFFPAWHVPVSDLALVTGSVCKH